VIVKDIINDATEEVTVRVLGPGDHFGVRFHIKVNIYVCRK
jgi:hypothetical protein